jgi:hypothetical protein
MGGQGERVGGARAGVEVEKWGEEKKGAAVGHHPVSTGAAGQRRGGEGSQHWVPRDEQRRGAGALSALDRAVRMAVERQQRVRAAWRARAFAVGMGATAADRWAPAIAQGHAGRESQPLMGGPRLQC